MTEEDRLTRLEDAVTILAKAQQQTTDVINKIIEALDEFTEAARKAGIK